MKTEDFWRLDRTFNIVLVIVTLVLTPYIHFFVFQEPPRLGSKFIITFFLAPLLLLVLLWWIATFFNKPALRIVCWYGLFYLICHSFSILIILYIISTHEYVETTIGVIWASMTLVTSYLLPIIPTRFIFKKYSEIQEPSKEKSKIGICAFFITTLILAIAGF